MIAAIDQSKTIYDAQGVPERLGKQIASGGEGSIWTLQNPEYANAVVKIYHLHKLREKGFAESTEQKIRYLITLDIADKSMAWPIMTVYTSAMAFIGYGMREVQGKKLSIILNPASAEAFCKGWDRADFCRLALDLSLKVLKLHRIGVILGDINDANFLVDLIARLLLLVDIDSCQICSKGKTFRCLVGRPEYTPPEYQGLDLGTLDRTKEADYFSMAILIFRLLMRGRHPFDIVGGGSPAENIRRGNFPYGTSQRRLIPKGGFDYLWSYLSRRLKDMFLRAFVDGHGDPSARPNTDDWVHALRIYLAEIAKGWHDPTLYPEKHKDPTYRGKGPK